MKQKLSSGLWHYLTIERWLGAVMIAMSIAFLLNPTSGTVDWITDSLAEFGILTKEAWGVVYSAWFIGSGLALVVKRKHTINSYMFLTIPFVIQMLATIYWGFVIRQFGISVVMPVYIGFWGFALIHAWRKQEYYELNPMTDGTD